MKTRNLFILIMTVLSTTALLLTAACAPNNTEDTVSGPPVPDNIDSTVTSEVIPIDIGEGSITFIFEVKDDKEDIIVWKVHTNESTVGAALLGVGLVEGTVSAMGLMVEYVNGLRADFMEDNAWWAFYINGEMAMEGVDSTDIEEGTVYAFIFTPA